MLDQNTDRMWYVIGAIIIGGLILTSSIVLFTDVAFASVQDAFSMLSNVADVNEIPDYYVLATDDDFEWIQLDRVGTYYAVNEKGKGYYHYVGNDEYVEIPQRIRGQLIPTTMFMFDSVDYGVRGVAMNSPAITMTKYMFYNTESDSIELDYLNVSGVEVFHGMFERSRFKSLDISGFNTEFVRSTGVMFYDSDIQQLTIGDLNLTNVSNMKSMFWNARVDEIDLSKVQFNKDSEIDDMFKGSKISRVYVGSHEDMVFLSKDITNSPGNLRIVMK